MKILMLSDALSIHTKRWVNSLSEKRIEIYLFSLRKPDDFYTSLCNVNVYSVEKSSRTSLISKISYLSVVPRVKQLIKEIKPDILHAHYASSYGLIGALTGFHPYIVSVWGSDVYDFPKCVPLGKSVIKYVLKKADKLLSTSNVMAKEASKYTDKQFGITPFGVDTKHFRQIDGLRPVDEFVVGNVKTLEPKYGIDVLISAFKIVKERNPGLKTRLLIYGRGSRLGEYQNLAKELGISYSVEFKGFIDNSRLPEVYSSVSVSVSVSVSDSESFGVVAVEAMACECPVVTSDADGFTEVVDDGTTGIIVPKRDPEATANAIQKLIDNPELRTKMGEAGRRRVKELYEWDNNVNKMVHIYEEIVRAKHL